MAIALLSSIVGCAGPSHPGARPVGFSKEGGGAQGGVVTQVELQQDLQRFASVFTERLAQASNPLTQSREKRVRDAAMRETLLYMSSVMDITSEPSPVLGLLDMIVFVELNKSTLDHHWIPEVFGARGAAIQETFSRSQEEIWAIADKVMSPPQKAAVRELIARWQAENPGQLRVEGVRLGDFSEKAGQLAVERARQSRGLLASVSSAVEVADQALLLADRALFLAQRMPFLLRMHVRVAMADAFTDLSQVSELQPLLGESAELMGKAQLAAQEAGRLAQSLYPLVPREGMTSQYLASLEGITDKTLGILQGSDRLMRRFLLGLLLLGGGLILFWWCGYYWVRRALARSMIRDADRAKDREQDRDRAA